ncbi:MULTISPECIES: aKG-HExxH-type peptide beta-hydroxylase [unclassified Streptomyces]|uniref:aKG-HExxH-type peptide beta-hydroxylase n=1 Tax=unclassified Streptomyces TaxID=2593676 RepID=UPI002E2D81CA|nr:HEXXH motif-containing putative peptide modification protein [Streptomyces sp. NBC_00285]
MHVLNVGHLFEMTARFSHAITGTYPEGADAVPAAYREAITPLRPMSAEGTGVSVSYEDGAWARHCREERIFEHIVGPATASDGPTRERWDGMISAALQLVHEINPDLGKWVDLFVTDIVVFNSGADGGGSANTLPGVVLMSPGKEWDVVQYAECIVHEGLHTGLFILDVVEPLFTLPPAELEKDEYRALSAVKIGQKRPLHAAFHAAVVAVPLMYIEDRLGTGDLVEKYGASLRAACADMQVQREQFTRYGRMLLDEMTEWAETLDFAQVARSISDPDYAGYQPAVAA